MFACRLSRLALVVWLLSPSLASAQTGLLVVAHGANSAWNAQVRETIRQVNWPHGPVATAFLMGAEAESAGWDAAVRELERAGSQAIVVVPLMVSSHGSHYRQVQHYAGLIADLPPELAAHNHGTPGLTTLPMRVTPALDQAPEVGTALVARWLAGGQAAADAPLLLLGHGPETAEDAARWAEAFASHGRSLREAGYRGRIEAAFLRDDAPPPVRAAAISAMRDTVTRMAAQAGDSVSVLTVLVATGPMTSARIPKDIAGLPVRYRPVGLTPHPAIARWIERIAAGSLAAR
ncbi:MAG TPA: CbiX/SirB N-terminal domain-containing protein [Gemmatimonadales bacterium]